MGGQAGVQWAGGRAVSDCACNVRAGLSACESRHSIAFTRGLICSRGQPSPPFSQLARPCKRILSPTRWPQGAAQAIAALHAQVEALQEGLASVPPPYDDSALAARLAVAEGMLATLEAALADAQGSVQRSAGAGAGHARELAALWQQVTALQQAVEGATADAAAGGAESTAELGRLGEAVCRLGEGQAALESALDGVSQVRVGGQAAWAMALQDSC